MDSLSKTLGNLSLYEVKHYVRKAQNAVLNLSEIESKVREATNNEPWGASSSLMAEIARGTFNYKDREEICNMIFRRFTEKSAHEWRQIYKALQLMEYLVKHGSERFVDDARANISLVSMLKSFHYIDSKGVDQGINVRNRAKELASLLNDESKIRQERRKAKQNSKKFGAISSNDASGYSAGTHHSSTSAYSPSSPDSDAYEQRIFGDGGVYGRRYDDTAAQNHYTSYQSARHHSVGRTNSHRSSRSSKPTVAAAKVTATAAPDLVSFEDEAGTKQTAPPAKITSTAPTADNDEEEDFGDFQSAPGPQASTSVGNSDLSDLLSTSYKKPTPATTTTTTTAPLTTASYSLNQQPKSRAAQTDLFGSLLASAKTKPATTTTKQPIKQQTQPHTEPATSNDSMDLLDL